MLTLLAGPNRSEKDKQIAELKKNILGSDSGLFDQDTFYANELDADTLKKSLWAFPALSSRRLVIVYQSQKLDEHCQDIVLKWLETDAEPTVLVLDFDKVDRRETFFKNISAVAKSFIQDSGKGVTVFDAFDEIKRGRCAPALAILHELLDGREDPMRVLGGILWSWGRERKYLSDERYQKGLLVIQEADVNMKRSRLDASYALEVALTKLFGLING